MHFLKKYWEEKPLLFILILAGIVRLLAVVFSKGFGMQDDHFLVIEPAQMLVDNCSDWLPGHSYENMPTGHSWFYLGLHYLLFLFLKFINITDPQEKMFIVRFLHALFSLIIVSLGFKITQKLSDLKTAKQVGLLLALFWFIPFLSVRNLVEIVCIPFLFIGIWKIIKYKNKNKSIFYYIITGFILGLSISVRYQLALFVGGIILAMLIQKEWKKSIYIAFGSILSFILIQGIIDYYIWGHPFAEFTEYVRYNFIHKYDYLSSPWYSYILLILGLLIPPVSIFLFFGFFKTWKKHLLIFLPCFIFLVFHSCFPNKQERFILPIVPFVIMLGVIGWNEFIEKSKLLKKSKYILKYSWILFWVINLMLLPVISTTYSKKSRVESMVYLSKYKNIEYLLLEDSNNGKAKMPPRYYIKQWVNYYDVSKKSPVDDFIIKKNKQSSNAHRFILFFGEENIKKRIKNTKNALSLDLKFETKIKSGFIDRVMYKLNPNNRNQTIFIYRIVSYTKPPEVKLF
jgi:hypothetical protein